MKRVIEGVLKPYKGLNSNFSKTPNNMLLYIQDPYIYKIYSYLCYRYNSNFDYAFPTIETIAKDCSISIRKTKYSIKWLKDMGYIVVKKFKSENGVYKNNIYYIRYLEIDIEKTNKEIISSIEEEIPIKIEIEIDTDE